MVHQNAFGHLVGAALIALLFFSCNSSTSFNTGSGQTKGAQVMCVPPTHDRDWYLENKNAPLFEGLDGIEFTVTTANELARRYFRQGLMLTYGFNHAEAARSFFQVTREDPACAMGYWGYAYVLGSNYNAPMDPEDNARAFEATRKAKENTGKTSEIEKALILALQSRYSMDTLLTRQELDEAYAEAMKQVWREFPEDPDVGALYAESLMNLHPWDLWLPNGDARPWTGEILEVLEKTLASHPEHAGANHLYIHAVEASPFPEKGLGSARLLENLVPGSSHLVHMPSHIYINTGDYHRGSVANLRAVEVDSSYVETCHAYGVFPLLYYPHNYHFLSATATLEGNSEIAMMAARKVAGMMNLELMRTPGMETLQHYYLIPFHIAVKFNRWEEVLQMTIADSALPYLRAVHHYARGLAYLGKGNIQDARAEADELEMLEDDPVIAEMMIWEINPVKDLVKISSNVLRAELLAVEGSFEESISLLEEAVKIEDGLRYSEPPDWFFSVRHELGNILLKAGKYSVAERIFQEDLVNYPANGWAYYGLYRAFSAQAKTRDAEEALNKYLDAWQWSDFELALANDPHND